MASVNIIPKNNILSRLWCDSVTIYEYQEVTDPNTFQTTVKPVAVYQNEPCRISFYTEQVTNLTSLESGLAQVAQRTKLFIRPDITIKAGSLLEVTHNGVVNTYKRTSEPAVYTNHQEITIALDKEV